MTDKRSVVLTDASAIKVLAHPARLMVVERLFAARGAALTATELAEEAGLTASAMSYHLRALERHGVVERAEGDGDERRRPWRAAGDELQVRREVGAGDASRAAVDLLVGQMLDQLRDGLAAMSERLPADDERWRVGGLSPSTLHLDPAQTKQLAAELNDLVEGWVEQSRPGGPGTRPVQVTVAVVPGGPR